MTRPRKKDKHLPRCVYERHGAFYYVKAGKWTRLGADLPSALAEYGRRFDTRTGGMPELIERVMAQILPKLAPNSQAQYRLIAAKLKTMLSDFTPDQVKPKHIADVKVKLSATPNMANRVLSVLRIIFQHAVEWQIVDSNPCIGIKRHEEAKRKRYITDAEYAAIHACANPRMRVIMDLLYLTGQRISDVLAIKRSDITEEGIAFKQKKTGALLMVRWTPDIAQVIQAANELGGNVHSLNLFRSRYGTVPSYGATHDQWREAVVAAGVEDATIHDLRAKSLTDARRQGKDATMLAGHTSKTMTERYIRLRETPRVDGPSFGQSKKMHA